MVVGSNPTGPTESPEARVLTVRRYPGTNHDRADGLIEEEKLLIIRVHHCHRGVRVLLKEAGELSTSAEPFCRPSVFQQAFRWSWAITIGFRRDRWRSSVLSRIG